MCLAEAHSLSIIKMPFTRARLCFGGLNYLAMECELAAAFGKSCQNLDIKNRVNTNLYPQPVPRHPHGPWPLVSVSKWVLVAPLLGFPPPKMAPHGHDEVLNAADDAAAAGGEVAVVPGADAAAAGEDYGDSGSDSGSSAAKGAGDGPRLVATVGR